MKLTRNLRMILQGALIAALLTIPAASLMAQDSQPDPAPQAVDDVATKVKDLVKKLQSNDYDERQAATEEIQGLGKDALPALKAELESTTDPDLTWRLEELIEKAQNTRPNPNEGQGQGEQRRPMTPFGGGGAPGMAFSMTVFSEGNTYTRQQLPGGRIRATFKPRDGEAETREFDSDEQFREEWPEVAGKFGGMRLRIQPAQPRDPNQTEPQPEPFPGPFGGGQAPEELQRMMEDMLRRMMERDPNADPDQGNPMQGLREMMEEMQRRSEDMQRQLEELGRGIDEGARELQRRLDEMRNNRPDPFGDPDAFRKWQEEYQRLLRGEESNDGETRPDDGQQQQEEEFLSEEGEADGRPSVASSFGGASFGPISAAIRTQLQLAEGEGLLVTGVSDGVLASTGLARYDILLSVNGRPVSSVDDVKAALYAVPEGSEFVITVIRKKERLQLLSDRD